MSKKALLEEGSVRQFMKLANLKPLAEEFVTEMYKDKEKDDEEKMEEQEVNEEEETVTESEESLEEGSCGEKNEEAVNEETEEVTEGEEETVTEEAAAEEAAEEEMEDELGDMGEPEEAAGEMDKEDMLRDVVNAVAKVLDVDVNFGDDEASMDMGAEDDAAADLDMDAAAGLDMDAAADLDDAPAMRQYDEEFDLDAVVAEVTKRVKERLLDTKE
jgi:hypothetical protein